MTTQPHVTVLGAGILGAATAQHLAKKGANVTIVDAEIPAGRSTSASFACVNGSAKTDADLAALNDRAVDEYHQIAGLLGDAAVRFTGQHFVATDAESLRSAEHRINAARTRGYGGELIGADTFRQREPHLRLDTQPLAIAWFPADGWVDPKRARARFLRGLSVHNRKAVAISPARSGRLIITFDDDDERVETDRVINATGASVADIELPFARPPLEITTGFVVAANTGKDPVKTVVRTPKLGVRPDGPNRVVLHSHDVDALFDIDQITEERAADILLNRARQVFPDVHELTATRVSRGPRPAPAGGRPSIGEIPDLPGYYELSAHSGVTLAPLLGRLVAEEILTDTREPILESFRPAWGQ